MTCSFQQWMGELSSEASSEEDLGAVPRPHVMRDHCWGLTPKMTDVNHPEDAYNPKERSTFVEIKGFEAKTGVAWDGAQCVFCHDL